MAVLMRQSGCQDQAEGGPAEQDGTRAWNHPVSPLPPSPTAGHPYGVDSDATVTLDVPPLGDLLEVKARTWRA
jgi:hypothetical protein